MEFLASNIELESSEIISEIWENVSNQAENHEGITGYKTPSLGKDSTETPSFIIRSAKLGIIIIDLVIDNIVEFDEENEFWKTSSGEYIYSRDLIIDQYQIEVENRLKEDKDLYDVRKREWKVEIKTEKYIIFTQNKHEEIAKYDVHENKISNEYFGIDNYAENLSVIFSKSTEISQENIDIIDSILDGSNIYAKVIKQKIEKIPENINEYIKKSLDYTFKLDSIQRQVALQIPSGPQRIRGLAGTGKTVILCMKAALAHKFFPEMKILFVFNTQSMYSQVESLITNYYFNEAKKLPNWDNLHVFHAWGGSNKAGVYYNTANSVGVRPLNYMNVRRSEDPLDVIYTDLLKDAKHKITPQYDMVLIDEAQDFPASFFETIYYLTKFTHDESQSKRIVWAYDEFQSLTDIKIKEPEELFGFRDDGKPNIPNSALDGEYKGKVKKDFVLPNSYRNPRINLMIAHGLALGLYSAKSKMPMEYKKEWDARGYTVIKPNKVKFEEDDDVEVERESIHSKNNLEKLLQARQAENNLVQNPQFSTLKKQLDTAIERVVWLINEQKVEPEEILIINLDTKNSKDQFQYIRQGLDMRDVKCITPGFIEGNDAFKVPGFVTLSTPFRAKGNEANIVFILNTQKVVSDLTLRMRNAIFVSITRSRGWCYIYGYGDGNLSLQKEIEDIQSDYPRFKFIFPSDDEIQRRYAILSSNQDLEKADSEINTLFGDAALRALLLEKLSQDPKLLEEIKKFKESK